ncbi:MAG: hypothetical protein ACYDA1_01000 [Vulcanimicrobiaceae bacterium]
MRKLIISSALANAMIVLSMTTVLAATPAAKHDGPPATYRATCTSGSLGLGYSVPGTGTAMATAIINGGTALFLRTGGKWILATYGGGQVSAGQMHTHLPGMPLIFAK